jgi:hypothetical protein
MKVQHLGCDLADHHLVRTPGVSHVAFNDSETVLVKELTAEAPD